MQKRFMLFGIVLAITTLFVSSAFAEINRVRIVNSTNTNVYIHKGGFAASVKIPPGQWKIFYYPFQVIPPGTSKKTASSLIVATAGGRWMTTPNGFTYLSKPEMMICLDYKSAEHAKKTGNRVWTIKRASGFDPNCKVQGYKQPWFQPAK